MLPTIRKTSVIQKYKFLKDYAGIYRIPFPDNEDLRNVKIWGVQTYYGSSSEFQVTPFDDGILLNEPDYTLPVIPKFTFLGTFLTLYDKNNVEFLKQCPAMVFQTIQNNEFQFGKQTTSFDICERDNKVFTGQFLDLQNSYYEIINANIEGEYSIFTEFYYSRIDLDTQTKIN